MPAIAMPARRLSGGTNLLIITAPRDAFEHLSGEVQRYRRTRDPDARAMWCAAPLAALVLA